MGIAYKDISSARDIPEMAVTDESLPEGFNPASPEWVTTRQIAERYNVSPGRVRQWTNGTDETEPLVKSVLFEGKRYVHVNELVKIPEQRQTGRPAKKK